MKTACILFVAIFALSSSSLSQTNTSRTAYPPSTLSNGINLRAVAGAPFSADVVSQSTLTQADGTPVTQKAHGKMFRDSAGRTRSETELQSSVAGAAGRRIVTIVDPVQGTSMVLDVAAKSATVFHLPAASADRVNLAAAAHASRAGIKQLTPPGSADLGGMMMEGFAVIGTRRAGASEAAKAPAQNIVTESWFSKELKVDLLVSRQGQSVGRTTRLTNITPGEPDPTVFQVPADYSVRENSLAKGVTQ